MNGPFFPRLILFVFLICGHSSFSQYILNGTAQQHSCNCYALTQPVNNQTGSVWNNAKINLNNPFDFWFNVYLGCFDLNGADGMVFMLQPISTSIGSVGGGMGFQGVSPSIGIALDTYQNIDQNDPAFDHISIQANGNINHNNDLAGPVQISPVASNVEDCSWHKLRISWDPVTKWLRAYFDGSLRVEKQIDLISTIFNNDPMVYWGFSAATGGAVNLQEFCTALDPNFLTSIAGNGGCVGEPVQFNNLSESFAPIASYTWDFGDGNTSNVANPPPHVYTNPGPYEVQLKVKGLDGCENDTVRVINIGSIPVAQMTVSDVCEGLNPTISFSGNNWGVQYEWRIDNNFLSNTQQPPITTVPQGNHQLQLIVTSLYNCGRPDTATRNFVIRPAPHIETTASQQCNTISWTSNQLDNLTTITGWNWTFGDGGQSSVKDPVHQYAQAGQFPVKLWAIGLNGCASDTLKDTVIVPQAFAFAGNDTMVIRNQPFNLNGAGNGSFDWSPGNGLSNPFIANPVLTPSTDMVYLLTVNTPEGCTATDTIRIKVFDGPAVYVPSAFTPNGDGLNDLLRPTYVGISKIDKFLVYNRWGEVVFSTSDMKKAWDGTIGGKLSGSGSFVWFVKAETILHQQVVYKGMITIIR